MTHSSDAHSWRQLAEYRLPNAASSERLVVVALSSAVQELHLPEPLLTQLQTALAAVVHHRVACLLRTPRAASLLVVVYVAAVSLADLGVDGEANKTPPVWGFFLVERTGDGESTADNPSRHLICLYLYPEGMVRQL
jgi:hypothetical protein